MQFGWLTMPNWLLALLAREWSGLAVGALVALGGCARSARPCTTQVQANTACPVCGPGGARLREGDHGKQWQRGGTTLAREWDAAARRLLWTAKHATAHQCGTNTYA